MTKFEKMLKLVVDRPGINVAEIAEELDVTNDNVTVTLARFVQNGKLLVEKKAAGVSGKLMNHYTAAPSLVAEMDGVKQLVLPARAKPGPKARADLPDGSDLRFGFFSNGALQIAKSGRAIELSPGEATALIEFLDSINIEKIASPT